uniref:Uncharacterized protein n=1 Tax=Equus asinus TaxID=9793 RepID=A0A9L0IA96_EQUAS
STAGAGAGGGGKVAGGRRRGTLQKLALRRKKALNAQEMEPDWLRRRLGAPSTPPCSKIRLALLMLHVAPLAVLQMLRPCTGHAQPQDSGLPWFLMTLSLVCSERNKGSSALGGGQAVAERGGREGSGQRMSCQPIAARLLVGGMGKSPPRRGP